MHNVCYLCVCIGNRTFGLMVKIMDQVRRSFPGVYFVILMKN